jgi:hypothetical protein
MTLSKKDRTYLETFEKKYKSDANKDIKKNLAREIAKYFEDTYTNLRTITTKVTQAKKWMREKTNDKDFYLNINPKKEITQNVIRINIKKLEENREFQKIKKSEIDKFLNEYRDSLNIYEIGFYILLNTGRRINEMIKNIEKFTNKPRSNNIIYFSGILKKRKKDEKSERVEIMTIDNKKDVMNAIRKMKKLLKMKNKTSFQRSLQSWIKKLSGEHKWTSHMLRSIYANYLFVTKNPKNQIYNAYIRERLHHKNLATSINYSDVKIIDDTKKLKID